MNGFKGFIDFIRERGVVGLSVGFIIGGAITKLVSSIVNDLVNPILGVLLGAMGNLSDYKLQVGGAQIMYGKFISSMIDFLIIVFIVYVGLKLLRLEKIDKKKEALKDAAAAVAVAVAESQKAPEKPKKKSSKKHSE